MTKWLCKCWNPDRPIPCPDCRQFPERENSGQEEGRDAVLFPNGKTADDVRQPSHYTVGGIETIDYMAAKASVEEFRGHLRLTALKYLSRAGHKDDALKDYKKAAVYLGWLIKHLETGSHK